MSILKHFSEALISGANAHYAFVSNGLAGTVATGAAPTLIPGVTTTVVAGSLVAPIGITLVGAAVIYTAIKVIEES